METMNRKTNERHASRGMPKMFVLKCSMKIAIIKCTNLVAKIWKKWNNATYLEKDYNNSLSKPELLRITFLTIGYFILSNASFIFTLISSILLTDTLPSKYLKTM